MPSNTNSIGTLTIPDGKVDSDFLYQVNDRLSRIATALGKRTSAAAVSGSTTTNGVIGQLVLAKAGILSVQADVCPSVVLSSPAVFTTAVVLLKQAPIGSPVSLQLVVNGSNWGPALTVTALSTTFDVSSAGSIGANQLVRVDVTAVGALLTGVSFPGSDLTVILR